MGKDFRKYVNRVLYSKKSKIPNFEPRKQFTHETGGLFENKLNFIFKSEN